VGSTPSLLSAGWEIGKAKFLTPAGNEELLGKLPSVATSQKSTGHGIQTKVSMLRALEILRTDSLTPNGGAPAASMEPENSVTYLSLT
jgi:hypothetical protein